jgi:hypothetical protein
LPDLNVAPALANWFAKDPLLCFSILICVGAAIRGWFRQGRGDDAGGLWDSDGGDSSDSSD